MPRSTRRCDGSASRSIWPSSTLPVAGMAPIRARKTVVLQALLRPMRPHISPSRRSNVASRMTGIRPIETPRPTTLRISRSPLWGGRELRAADEHFNLWIGKHTHWGAVCNHGAVMEGKHPVGKARHDVHVVLDEQDGDLPTSER